MIKKTVVTAMLFLAVIFTLGATSSYADSIGKVTVNKLNIRTGPSVRYNIIGCAQNNQVVNILESKNGWHKIQMKNNRNGWLSGKYVSVEKDDNNVSTNQGGVSTDQGSVNTNDDTNKATVKVVATAYTGYSTTSTGQKPVWGTIAVDPKVIPYGTKVYIPCFDRVFVANNTGGAIKGNKIDIYMNSNKECYNWGRRTIDIQILK